MQHIEAIQHIQATGKVKYGQILILLIRNRKNEVSRKPMFYINYSPQVVYYGITSFATSL